MTRDKQSVRNELSTIEDDARELRRNDTDQAQLEYRILTLIARLAQIIREDIIK